MLYKLYVILIDSVLNTLFCSSQNLPVWDGVLQPIKAWQVHSGFREMEENAQNRGDG